MQDINRISGLLLTASLMAAAPAVRATTYVLESASSGEKQAFDKAGWWRASGTSTSVSHTPCAGNDYVIINGYQLGVGVNGGDSAEHVFLGDSLTIGQKGADSSWGGGQLFQDGHGTVIVNDLILAQGRYVMYQTAGTPSESAGCVQGRTKVVAPLSNPFYIVPGWGETGWTVRWDASISSDDYAAGLMVGSQTYDRYVNYTCFTNCNSTVIFAGDNSNYKGTIIANGSRATFKFTTAAALGANDAFNPKGLVIQNGVTVAPTVDGIVLAGTANRGIYVEETGGKLNVPANMSLTVAWPVGGKGTLTKTGAGTMVLDSAWAQTGVDSSEGLAVAEGTVAFGSGFSRGAGNTISLAPGCAVTVPVDQTVTVDGLSLEEGVVGISYDETSGKSGVLVLGENCSVAWPLKVKPFAQRVLNRVPFLKVPVSYGELNAKSFAAAGDLAVLGLPSMAFEVELDGGFYVVYATSAAVITAKSATNKEFSIGNTTYVGKWSDDLDFHMAGDYQLPTTSAERQLYIYGVKGGKISDEYEFPSGSSLTFGSTGSQQGIRFFTPTVTGDFRLGNYVKVFLCYLTPNDAPALTLNGSIHFFGTASSDGATDFRTSGKNVILNARLTGSGNFSFQKGGTIELNGDNAFTGCLRMWGETTLKFAKCENLGANPSSLLKEGFWANGTVTFHATDSLKVALSNRGFYMRQSGVQFKVDSDKAFELNAPVYLCKGTTTKKTGGGILSLSGTVALGADMVANTTPEFLVEDGCLDVKSANLFKTAITTFADGTGIAVTYDPTAAGDVANYGLLVTDASKFAVSGDTLVFRIATNDAKVSNSTIVPVLTVPASLASVIDAKRILVESDVVGRAGVSVKENVTIGGDSYVRYAAGFQRGMAVILR